MAFQQSTAVPVVSTSKKKIEYNWFNLFHSTGSRVSFFPALLTFGPSNSCSKKKSHTICMEKFLLKVDLNCSEGGYPLKLGGVEYLNKLPSLFMDHSCMYRNNFVIKFNVMLVEIEWHFAYILHHNGRNNHTWKSTIAKPVVTISTLLGM